ncbi:hypothetical protein VQ044_25010 [Aurantimonas sp. C2-5-R2]|uniref:hypothetical protein n=1 Tax=Aurantimonas sp. C2-5-R2 TaxID=3113713 RepID=UPI002F9342F2
MLDAERQMQLKYLDKEFAATVRYCREEAGWTTEELLQLKHAIASYRGSLKQLAAAYPKGWSKQRAIAKAGPLSSKDAVFVGVLRIAARHGLSMSRSQALGQAGKISMWKALAEPVVVHWEPKGGGKYRSIVKYGILRAAQQLPLRDVLSMMGIDSEFDYTRKGAGGERAFVHEIKQSMTDGRRWWWTPDIENCFPSMRPKHFDWLPVDKRLLKTVIFLPKCTKIRVSMPKEATTVVEYLKQTYPDFVPSDLSLSLKELLRIFTDGLTRQGMPQGSMLAPLLARAFIGRELRHVVGGKELHASTVMDDLCIGSCEVEAVIAVAGAVTKRLEAHPAGAINLHAAEPSDMKKGIRVIGYWITHEGDHKPDPVHVKPGGKRIERSRVRLLEKLQQVAGNRKGPDLLEVYDELMDVAVTYAKRWRSVSTNVRQPER